MASGSADAKETRASPGSAGAKETEVSTREESGQRSSTTTRSGRNGKPPDRMKDFACNAVETENLIFYV